MTQEGKDKFKEFAEAVRRLPPPITCFANGAPCPWCGWIHKTVTFGSNACLGCAKHFCFGYPDWHEGKDPVSWVPFPNREFDALGGKASLLPDWTPTDLLKSHYHDKAEEASGIHADDSKPQ